MKNLKEAMTGLLVGDALGLPFQFLDRDTFVCTDMVGYGTYHMPVGSFSDDGSLALATLDSLQKNNGINLNHMADCFCDWLFNGAYTQYGTAYDVGFGTQDAIHRYKLGASVELCGGRDIHNNGNGSLMRILPMAFFSESEEEIEKVSALTHAHEIAKTACKIYIAIAQKLLDGVSASKAIHGITEQYKNHQYFGRLWNIETLGREQIRSSGYVVDSLEAALWALLTTNNYKDCLLLAVNLGNDTDSIGAIAGGLAGIIYGIGGSRGIPQSWADLVTQEKWVQKLLNN